MGKSLYKFNEMEVDEVRFYPIKGGSAEYRKRVRHAIVSSASQVGKRWHGAKFASRIVPGGVKVWRFQ